MTFSFFFVETLKITDFIYPGHGRRYIFLLFFSFICLFFYLWGFLKNEFELFC